MEPATPGNGSDDQRPQADRVERPWNRLRSMLFAVSQTDGDTWSTLVSRLVR